MNNLELPASWLETDLGAVAHVASGIGFPNEYQGHATGDIPFFKVGDISEAVLNQNGRLVNGKHYVTHDVAGHLRGKPLQPGTTVFAKIGEAIRLNRRAYVTTHCLVDNNVMAVKATLDESNRYIYYFLRTVQFADILRATTVPSLRKGDVEGMQIPLAPLPEQKRIADKLDSVLARVDACRDRLDHLPALLKRFRQSILAAATSGRLTKDWLGTRSETKHSVPLQRTIQSIRTGPFGSTLHKADYVLNGTPIINPMHIVRGQISPSSGMTVDAKTAQRLVEYQLAEGDVVIGRRGEMGRCAVVTSKEVGWICGTGSMVLKPSAKLDPTYLQLFLSSPDTVRSLEGESVGSTMVNLNQKILLGLDIYYPDISEQHEIVRRVDILFAFANHLEARLATARKQVEQLTPALLAKAFRGELVPQDPADEPAAELLKRLAATRAAAPPIKRGRKTAPKTKSMG